MIDAEIFDKISNYPDQSHQKSHKQSLLDLIGGETDAFHNQRYGLEISYLAADIAGIVAERLVEEEKVSIRYRESVVTGRDEWEESVSESSSDDSSCVGEEALAFGIVYVRKEDIEDVLGSELVEAQIVERMNAKNEDIENKRRSKVSRGLEIHESTIREITRPMLPSVHWLEFEPWFVRKVGDSLKRCIEEREASCNKRVARMVLVDE